MNPPKTERNQRIVELRKAGLSLQETTDKLAEEGHERITLERVRQIWVREKARE